MENNAIGVALFKLIHHESPRYNHVFSKRLNTYGVESPYFPRVGSFLANPGLSKEQLVPSCVVITFVIVDSFIKHKTYGVASLQHSAIMDSFMETLA